jgi:hypothetical protein
MKRIYTLIIIAVITFLIVLFVMRPDLLSNIWLWILGLIGPIIKGGDALFKSGAKGIKNLFSDEKPTLATVGGNVPQDQSIPTQPTISTQIAEKLAKPFHGTTLQLIRFSDDGQTTIGLLYINNNFFCYTLEDTYRDDKIQNETRIPSGIYNVDFLRYETDLTKKYRTEFDWFSFHLEIQNIPNYQGVYIHKGNHHEHTAGCVLVSESLSVTDAEKKLTNSNITFKRLYQFVEKELNEGITVRIVIKDESWINQIN